MHRQCCVNYFNSRPHEEVDREWNWLLVLWRGISTHDLTKRSTLDSRFIRSLFVMDFNSRPHEEVDVMVPWEVSTVPRFQLTTSRRGRHLMPSGERTPSLFQLTTSRRGRPSRIFQICIFRYFNSRPHEEVDNNPKEVQFSNWIFQLTTSRRGRQISSKEVLWTHQISTHDLTKRSTVYSW